MSRTSKTLAPGDVTSNVDGAVKRRRKSNEANILSDSTTIFNVWSDWQSGLCAKNKNTEFPFSVSHSLHPGCQDKSG